MAIQQLNEYTCDLCQDKKRSQKKPNGWVLILVENRYVDRSFYEKCICKNCVEDILSQAKVQANA